jgi:hypothetical protein
MAQENNPNRYPLNSLSVTDWCTPHVGTRHRLLPPSENFTGELTRARNPSPLQFSLTPAQFVSAMRLFKPPHPPLHLPSPSPLHYTARLLNLLAGVRRCRRPIRRFRRPWGIAPPLSGTNWFSSSSRNSLTHPFLLNHRGSRSPWPPESLPPP